MQKKINEWSERKVSVTDLILKTVSAAFSDVPDANVIWRQMKYVASMTLISL